MPPKEKKALPILCAGASTASEEMLPRVSAFNRVSDSYKIVPGYVDVQPQRLASIATLAEQLGVQVHIQEGRIEDVLDATPHSTVPLALHVDNFDTIRNVTRHPAAADRTIFGYWIIAREDGLVHGMRMVLTPADVEMREEIASLVETLATITTQSGSDEVIGDRAPVRNRILERQYRSWFADHLIENLPRVSFGLPPTTSPIEASADGRVTSQLIAVDSRAGWRDLAGLSEAVFAAPLVPVRKGALMIAEIGPNGARFHNAKHRKGESTLRIDGCVAIDPETIADIRERARVRARQEAEARRVAEAAVTQKSAMSMTD